MNNNGTHCSKCGDRFCEGGSLCPVADISAELSAETPPSHCPVCKDLAKNPVKDYLELWTWNCKEGCNP